MSGAEWERAKVLFDAALDVAEEEREAFLENACSDQPDLYVTVRDLLRNHTDHSFTHSQTVYFTGRVFEPGTLVGGRFRIIRFIGRGGMGEIYECQDEALGATVALKTLKPELLDDTRAVGRFKREIHVARGVSHQNVCRIHELVEHGMPSGRRIPCLTMEFLRGETLAEAIARRGPFEPAEALGLIRQIAAGLEALHRKSILHRDLKPSNIMLTPQADGSTRAVVMDFGLAKVQDESSEIFETTLQPNPLGAPYFLAPELLRGQRPSLASDIYSFGLVVDEMVTRTRAWSTESVQALYYAKLWEKPIPPMERSDRIPAGWASAITRCIDAEPARRFSSVAAFVDALAADAEPVTAPRRIARKLLARRGWIAGGLIVACCGALAGAMVYMPTLPLAIFNIRNATHEPTYNYLVAGFTSEIVRRAALVPGIQAMPVHAAFSPGSALPARFGLNGELGLQGGKTALTLTLSDRSKSGARLWSRTFDHQQLNNPLQVESETLSAVVSALETADLRDGAVLFLRSRPATVFAIRRWNQAFGRVAPSADAPTSNNRAFDDYLRGRQLTEQVSPDTIRSGLDLLQRAVTEDPGFALAYAALSNASITMLSWNYVPQQSLLANANSFAQTAVELDPRLPEALQARALVRQTEWNWNGAKQDYVEALRLKPTFAVARRYYAVLVTLMGDPEEGVRQSRLALAADPYDQSAIPGFGLLLYISGRLEESVRTLEHAPNPDTLGVRRNLGEAYALLGAQASGGQRDRYFRQSLEQAEKVRLIEIRSGGAAAETPETDRMYAHFLAMAGKTKEAQPWVARVEADYRKGLISPAMLAWVYTALDRREEALDLLERAVAEKDRHMILAKVYPFLNSLHGDVRFQRLITQMGL